MIDAFLLPPLSLLLVALAGLLVARTHRRLGQTLLAGSLVLLWICATPFFAGGAIRLLESSVKAVDTQAQHADAIIILGGGTYPHAPEYGTDTVNEATLARLRYGAKLQRETGKPILLSGGNPRGRETTEAQQMKSVLEREFRVPVRWTEDASNNTHENAVNSYRLLHKAGIQRVYLVTHAWHMPRSARAFESAGFTVIPSPTAFTPSVKANLTGFLPEAYALYLSRIFMHELIGLLWHRIKDASFQR